MIVGELMVGDLVLHDGKVIRVDAVHKRKIGYHKTKGIRATEDYFKDRYRASQEYQQLRKKYGKAQADMIVGDEVNKMLRHNEKYQYGKIIKQAEQLKFMMDEVTAISIGSVNCKTELTVEEKCNAYDYLMKDARWLCKIYSMICNCEKESDIVKIESTIKLLAKGDMASEKVISRFE